ncbi:SRPBCC family protein [Actinopolymorpha pittospori]|uniref:Polyketide cyclase / dehydrase and lipid transport n=1 Tax=Actinopolymorpha pittospori TaxID=648752 RepID=A0A927RBI1_9ACTN|nr:SRPBCC family protein [Actinopolymorpha pittospori]MBE1608794.1 hypothetical protein [Actinopolymorpha pittospori]
MATAIASAVIAADVVQVWGVVRDFGKLADWHPGIATSVIEGGQTGDTVGCVRALTLTDGSVVRERLLDLDDRRCSFTYNFVQSEFPVRRYESTLTLTAVTDTGHTFAQWTADFDADGDVEKKLTATFGEAVFGTGLRALRDRFA